MSSWTCVLELGARQNVTSGSTAKLCEAIGNAADLRIHTDFRHNEHIEPASTNPEMVNEISEFHETCLLEDRWTAGFMTTRQPVALPDGFGSPPSMSFFMYNQDGRQAIARLRLDGIPAKAAPGLSAGAPTHTMPKYHEHDRSDADTNAPCSNFTYDFEVIRYSVRDNWRQVLAHDEHGTVVSGSIDDLVEAFLAGCEVKVAVRNLFSDLTTDPQGHIEHEVFIQTGWCYYYTEQKVLVAATHPLVRVRPAVPLAYESGGWDFAWLVARTDGSAALRIGNPYTLKFSDKPANLAVRWFVK